MTEAFTALRTELERRIEVIDADIGVLEEQVEMLNMRRSGLAARILGMDDARRLLADAATDPAPERPAEPAPPPERKRRDLQGAVMYALSVVQQMTEAGLVTKTGLPPASVHACLLRAVRLGKIKQADDFYYLPQPEPAPTLGEMRGIAPELTEGKAAEEFVREQRDEWLTEATTDARVLSSAEFVDQSNALRAALEAAGPAGIVAEKTMVAPAVIDEACIAGWAWRRIDVRGEARVYASERAIESAQ